MTDEHDFENSCSRNWRFVVEHGGGKKRLDQFLAAQLAEEDVSRERIKAWITDGACVVDGRMVKKPGEKLKGGETIELAGEVEPTGVTGEEGALHVLHEDAQVLVIDKPAGLTVHPAPSCREHTLVHRLVHHYPQIGGMEGMRPGIVHRLDKDTSGVMAVALDEGTRQRMSAMFAEREVSKTYLAVVRGVMTGARILDEPIGRHPTRKTKMAVVPESQGGRHARSDWFPLFAAPEKTFALVGVTIHTGRTHQIRVHLSHEGHPIVGDALYGGMRDERDEVLKKLARRQLLHAAHLEFEHPGTGEHLVIDCAPPGDFLRVMLHMSRRMQRVILTGNPGCGKSSVLAEFERAGVPVFSADAAVAQAYEPGGDGTAFLYGRYGEQFVRDAESPVDKKALFAAMKESDALRREVQAIVHPLVRHRMESFFQEHEQSARLAVAEVPLVLETGWERRDDTVLVGVSCPADVRQKRLRSSRGWDEETFATMESWQWPADKKLAECDVVADNSGAPEDLAAETRRVLNELAARRRDRVRALHGRFRALLVKPCIPPDRDDE